MSKRIISLLIVLVMVLGMMPTAAFATEADSYPVNIYGHSAQLNSFKLYTYTGGVKGTTDLLEGVADSDDSTTQCYTTSLPAGDYWLDAYDATGDRSGGIAITVEAKELNEIQPYRAYNIYASNSGWVLGTDYTISAVVSSQDKSITRVTEMGETTFSGRTTPSVLCLKGDTIVVTYTPSEARQAENYVEVRKQATMTLNSSSWSQNIPKGVLVNFQVPSGSTVDVGTLKDYYTYSFLTAKTVQKPEEGDWTYSYMIPQNTDHFYRVSNDQGVTYWNYAKWAADSTVTVTADDLYIGSSEFTKDTIYRYEKNIYDRADIYLNINAQGYMDMNVGQSYELNVFRNWMAIESYMNAKVALPDMHYTVIDMEGKPSDLVTITPDAKNSSVAKMTANKEGTAVVLVTYDAMSHMVGQSSTTSKQFSAIWPECTGVFVVTVGKGKTEISTNMLIDRFTEKTSALDAEHDILFYTGDAGASYTFTPESGCTVTVNRAVLGTKSLSYQGFTDTGVTVAENGAVTISGLTTGRHIVKIAKDGKETYQVITTRGVSYQFQETSGEPLAEDKQLKAGDSVVLQFSNLVNPAEKLSGAYNFNASVMLIGDDGATFTSNPGTTFGAYDFSGNPVRQKLTISIPKYWQETSYTLKGAIKMGGFGNTTVGGHRGITYAIGLNPNFTAPQVTMVLSALPEITIPLAKTEFLTGTLALQDEDGNPVSLDGMTVTLVDSGKNATTLSTDGTFKCLEDTYTYTVSGAGFAYATGSFEVTADGNKTFTITLNKTNSTAWDGSSMTEPAKDESGTYLIGTGAELAWFVNNSNSGNNKTSGKLTADIELGEYPWTFFSNFQGTFDGDGHSVSGVSISSTKDNTGFFGQLWSGTVKNLTLRGKVSSNKNNTGAIAGYINGGTVENCISYVEVTGSNYTGGLVGNVANATIRNSANLGNISMMGYSGGIVGQCASGAATVDGCYNAGTITCTGSGENVGGIIGNAGSYNVTINACYNLGAVNGKKYVGGIVGSMRSADASITASYNAGTVTADKDVGGVVGRYENNGKVFRTYYLDTTATSDISAAEAVNEQQLKNALLDGTRFAPTCDGYPALLWQKDAKFHTKPESGTVTAPNCTELGYTEYVCSTCNAAYRDDYVEALGHNWCNDYAGCDDCTYTAPNCTETGLAVRHCRFPGCEEVYNEVIPANGHTPDPEQTERKTYYSNCVCSVCDVPYVDYDDPRMEYLTIQEDAITALEMEDLLSSNNKDTYPWVYNAETQRFESSNQGVNSSKSITTITVTLKHKATLSFQYGTSSESSDRLYFYYQKDGGKTQNPFKKGGTVADTAYTLTLEPGEYMLKFMFQKDSSVHKGDDVAWFKNLSITAEHAVNAAQVADEAHLASAATCITPASYYYSCETCGASLPETFTYGTVDSTAHSMTETVVTATCGVEGYTQHTCELCGYNYRDNFVAALEHDYTHVVTPANYDRGGFTTHTCANCGDTYVDSYTDKLVRTVVSVYLSVSDDDEYVTPEGSGEVVGMKRVDVPYFDLALYGLEDFYFISESYGSGSGNIGDNTFDNQEPYENKVTMLHLFIYATEVYYLGIDPSEAGKGYLADHGLGTDVFNITGSTGSSFLQEIWGMDLNLNYYLNYEYPLASAGWGATSDQILLKDGDIVTLGHFSSWSFFNDPDSIFNYLTINDETVTYNAISGEKLNLSVYRAGIDMMSFSGTAHVPVEKTLDVYYAPVDGVSSGDVTTWTKLGTTDAKGNLTVDTSKLAVGEYILAVPGRHGEEITEDVCSTPGGILLTVAPCTEHDYTETVVAPTCTTEGYTMHTCARCGYNYRDSFVEATGHSFTDETVAPTCTITGYTLHTCETCGFAYVSDETDALGHNYDEAVTEPTHNAMGYTTYTCSVCGHSYVDNYTDALEHSFTSEVTKEPTCTTEGEMTFTCECGESYTEIIPMTEHSYTAVVTAPTCTAMGYTTYTCDCGESYVGDLTNVLEHNWEETVVESTCLSRGYTMVVCKDCDCSRITAITEAKGHTETVTGKVEATWHTEGYTGDTVCAVCGETLTKGKAIPALGCPSKAFTDVDTTLWYHEAVDYVVANKLMNGTSATTFEPMENTTRAMVATLLYRIAGEPDVSGLKNPFTDVTEKDWFCDAVVWAFNEGVVTGATATIFNPNDQITREQLAVMLWRYADKPEADEAVLKTFTDAASVGEYAKVAMAWAVETKLVNGLTATTLVPTGTANRAQIATILMRYTQK